MTTSKHITKTLIALTAVCVLSFVTNQADASWVAYNDVGGNLSAGNVTNISGVGNDRPAGSVSPSGTLVKFADNSSTGVTLAISGSSGTWNFNTGGGGTIAGDAHTLFNGFVDTNGSTDFTAGGASIILTFSGMDPTATYDIAMYSSRGGFTGFSPRLNDFIISDVDAFTNSSSVGTTISTDTLTNDKTTVDVIDNSNTGYVARYTGISSGADGDMQIETFLVGDLEFNALRLEEVAVPEPTGFALLAASIACVGLCRRRKNRG